MLCLLSWLTNLSYLVSLNLELPWVWVIAAAKLVVDVKYFQILTA